MTINSYNAELTELRSNLKICKDNKEFLKKDMEIVNTVLSSNSELNKLYRLKTFVNDRYFLNEEMITVLNNAIKYLKENREFDCVYKSYISRLKSLMRQYITKSQDPDFVKLRQECIDTFNSLFFSAN